MLEYAHFLTFILKTTRLDRSQVFIIERVVNSRTKVVNSLCEANGISELI